MSVHGVDPAPGNMTWNSRLIYQIILTCSGFPWKSYISNMPHIWETLSNDSIFCFCYIFFFLSVFGFLFTPFQFFSFVNELPPRFFWGRPHIPKRWVNAEVSFVFRSRLCRLIPPSASVPLSICPPVRLSAQGVTPSTAHCSTCRRLCAHQNSFILAYSKDLRNKKKKMKISFICKRDSRAEMPATPWRRHHQ